MMLLVSTVEHSVFDNDNIVVRPIYVLKLTDE